MVIKYRCLEAISMENALLIAALIVSAIGLILLGVCVFLLIKNRSQSRPEADYIKTMTELKAQVDSLKETLPLQIQSITSKSFQDLQASSNQSLNGFQNSVSTLINTNMNSINMKIDAQMKAIDDKVNQSLSEGFKGTADSMANLQKELGIVQEAQKNLTSLETDIDSLNKILSNNQQKGKYGEFQLELILSNMFGETKGRLYDTQYELGRSYDGSILKPDAVVFLD